MFERLRAWRTSVAKELGMPPYVIFHDATLRLIAASPPSTLDELRQVNGVGDTKLDKYGQAILDVLADHVLNAHAAELAGAVERRTGDLGEVSSPKIGYVQRSCSH